MRSSRLVAKLVVLLALAAAVRAAQAGDLSCIGVQAKAIEQRFKALPDDQQARYAGTLDRIKALAEQATTEMTDAEKDVQADRDAIKRAHPDATEAEIDELYIAALKESADSDARYARNLIAQYHVHIIEAQMIAAGSVIPDPREAQLLQQTSDAFKTARGGEGNAYGNLAASPTFEHLIGVVAASQEASRSGRSIPATAVARTGFDTSPELPALVRATKALSGMALAATGLQTVSVLRYQHLDEVVRSPAMRSAVVDKSDSPTWRAVNEEIAGALHGFALGGEATRRIAAVVPKEAPPAAPDEQHQWIERVAQAAEKTAEDVALVTKMGAPRILDELPADLAPLSPEPSR